MKEPIQGTHRASGKKINRAVFTPPNIITLCRIPLSIILLFLNIDSVPFFVCYILCGATDIADGITARKLHMETKLGAALDSISDALFVVVLAVVYLPHIIFSCALIILTIFVVVIRALSLIICFVRNRRAFFLHNAPNRLTGLLIFTLLLLYALYPCSGFLYISLAAAAVSAIIELYTFTTKKEAAP